MSLRALRELRRGGQKPGVVIVLVGPKPRWLEDDHEYVVVADDTDPRLMDWRPLVGLTVAVFFARSEPERQLAVLAGLEAVDARFFGVADPTGVYPMTEGAGEEHRHCLQEQWRALCR